MESLRPDRDELDRFQSRSPNKNMPGEKRVNGGGKPSSHSAGNPLIWVLVVILCVGNGFLAWGYWGQKNELIGLKSQVSEADDFITRSKLVIARLEGELSEAGLEMVQTGNQVEKKLAFLDSEMRKLWVVSNERNKKSIQKNESSLKQAQKTLDSVSKKVEAATKSNAKLSTQVSDIQASFDREKEQVKALRALLAERKDEVSTKIKSIENSVAVATMQATSSTELIGEEIAEVRKELVEQQKRLALVGEHKKAIDAIDQSRVLLNERIVNLEKRLDKIQGRINSAGTTLKAEPAAASDVQ